VVGGSILLAPQLGWASSGGTSPSGGGVPPSSGSPRTGQVRSGDVTESTTGGGITLAARASAFLRGQLRFTGSVSPAAAGEIVEIERSGRQTQGQWTPTTHATVRRDGSFAATWPANHIGQFAMRAVVKPTRRHRARAASVSPPLTVTVYRLAIATIYGPGFYGQRTACGQTLTRHTLGVANRTLRCGTSVSIYYHGRTIAVPVIDRGPYANHADWDLTEATANDLRMGGTETIGAVSVPAGR
jgi:hypothetical protein